MLSVKFQVAIEYSETFFYFWGRGDLQKGKDEIQTTILTQQSLNEGTEFGLIKSIR